MRDIQGTRERLNHLELKIQTHDSCESIAFRGAQILIHQDNGKTIIEIHSKLGWRMSKFINPFRVSTGMGGGEIVCDARTVLSYSERVYQQDKGNMDTKAMRRRRNVTTDTK